MDPDWFARAYKAVGKEIWSKLYDAAKFASTGKGHTRARLFADALTDKISVGDLKESLEEKGNLDAAPALGLPSLPASKKARTAELLRRYGILQALRKRSLKSKAQRAASEQTAFEMGVRNLARRAGFSDTLRFEWAMETEAVADFGTLNTMIDGIRLTVGITPSGALELNASRSGQTVGTLFCGVASHAGTTPMGQRRDAGAAVAELILWVEQRAAADGDSVGTVGILQVPAGSINVIPGRCQFSLDLRAPTNDQRDRLAADVLTELEAICARRGVQHRLAETMRASAAPCAPWQARWEAAVASLGLPLHRMPSGAGHDAMQMHTCMPQAMLFVRGQNSGISHNPLESTTSADMQLALEAFTRLTDNLAIELS